MRIGVVALQHESNTFVAQRTTLSDFEADILLTGAAVRERLESTYHEVAGFFAGVSAAEAELVPIFFARAIPGGPMETRAFHALVEQMFAALDEAAPLDGVLAAPHGAAVCESIGDADGYWLARLRQKLGPHVPLIATVDAHANVSQVMIDACDAMIAYRTNPHLDQRQRGIEAARLMVRTLRGEIRPVVAAALPPVSINIERQLTSESPCLELAAQADTLRRRPEVLSVSVVLGFPYADVPEMGSSLIVVADRNASSRDVDPAEHRDAQALANELAGFLWRQRTDFLGQLTSVDQALDDNCDLSDTDRSDTDLSPAVRQTGPDLLLDMGDNVGGGGPGDGTALAAAIEARGAGPALVTIFDPESQQAARQTGIGGRLTLHIGGKADPSSGDPLVLAVEVLGLSETGQFDEPAIRHGGYASFDMGPTAVVRTLAGQTIVLTSRRLFPVSSQQWQALSIDPTQYRWIVAKGVHAPIAAYQDICRGVIRVNTPGVTTADMESLSFRHRRVPLYPFERDAVWPLVDGISDEIRPLEVDGHRLLQTTTVDGFRPGPRLLISGGVHGDEFEPMVAVRRLARSIDARRLRGSVTLVPVVNESAFERRSRCGDDGLDLARSFPGRPDGRRTERVAAALSKLILQADYYIDLHTGGTEYSVLPLAGYLLHADAHIVAVQRRMARAFNLPVVWGTDARLDGRSLSVARDAGVPAIYAEHHGAATCDPGGVAAYVAGCLNVLAELDMTDQIAPPVRVKHVVEDPRPDSGYLQVQNLAPCAGYFEPDVALGQTIERGDSLGVIYDVLGESSTPVNSPHAGVVLMLRTFPRVDAGDALAVILETGLQETNGDVGDES